MEPTTRAPAPARDLPGVVNRATLTTDSRASGARASGARAPGIAAAQGASARGSSALAARYRDVRARTEALCAPLEVEDYVVRSMSDVSPAKWHLAHTSWFFETFVLGPHAATFGAPYAPLDPRYAFLFNSYYVQAGERHCRAQRGLATRPTVAQVYAYRAHVDRALLALLDALPAAGADGDAVRALVELGLQHEQQHQELLLTDVKHVLWTNPLRPAYREPDAAASGAAGPNGDAPDTPAPAPTPTRWLRVAEGVHEIGHDARTGAFAYDNEEPRHRVYLAGCEIAARPVTNGEWMAFIADGGYTRAELWLSPGFDAARAAGWEAPLYWERDADGAWTHYTLDGTRPVDPAEAVCHVSFYEADAFARWAGARLPTEAEWEAAAAALGTGALDAAPDAYADGVVAGATRGPRRVPADGGPSHWFGDVWQWTASPYVGYPGYRPPGGAIGEYNGKWMADQWVLRGASLATPRSHARLTYRNFFAAPTRWQFSGVRLARDLAPGARRTEPS